MVRGRTTRGEGTGHCPSDGMGTEAEVAWCPDDDLRCTRPCCMSCLNWACREREEECEEEEGEDDEREAEEREERVLLDDGEDGLPSGCGRSLRLEEGCCSCLRVCTWLWCLEELARCAGASTNAFVGV